MNLGGISDETRRLLASIGEAQSKAYKIERMERLRKATSEILLTFQLHNDDPEVVAVVKKLIDELKIDKEIKTWIACRRPVSYVPSARNRAARSDTSTQGAEFVKPVDIRSHSVRLPMRLLHNFMHTRGLLVQRAGAFGLFTATFSIQQITTTQIMTLPAFLDAQSRGMERLQKTTPEILRS